MKRKNKFKLLTLVGLLSISFSANVLAEDNTNNLSADDYSQIINQELNSGSAINNLGIIGGDNNWKAMREKNITAYSLFNATVRLEVEPTLSTKKYYCMGIVYENKYILTTRSCVDHNDGGWAGTIRLSFFNDTTSTWRSQLNKPSDFKILMYGGKAADRGPYDQGANQLNNWAVIELASTIRPPYSISYSTSDIFTDQAQTKKYLKNATAFFDTRGYTIYKIGQNENPFRPYPYNWTSNVIDPNYSILEISGDKLLTSRSVHGGYPNPDTPIDEGSPLIFCTSAGAADCRIIGILDGPANNLGEFVYMPIWRLFNF